MVMIQIMNPPPLAITLLAPGSVKNLFNPQLHYNWLFVPGKNLVLHGIFRYHPSESALSASEKRMVRTHCQSLLGNGELKTL